jgi:transcription antitermination factor NusA-like protein
MDQGEITDFDIDITREFFALEKENSFLKDVSFVRVIDYGDFAIFIVGKGDKARMESHPEILEHFQSKFEISSIQLVEFSTKLATYVENLILPAKLLGFDEIFLPMGTSEYKARIDKNTQDKMLLSVEDLESLIQELTGKTVAFSFE